MQYTSYSMSLNNYKLHFTRTETYIVICKHDASDSRLGRWACTEPIGTGPGLFQEFFNQKINIAALLAGKKTNLIQR